MKVLIIPIVHKLNNTVIASYIIYVARLHVTHQKSYKMRLSDLLPPLDLRKNRASAPAQLSE
jgi:hypothetical protein